MVSHSQRKQGGTSQVHSRGFISLGPVQINTLIKLLQSQTEIPCSSRDKRNIMAFPQIGDCP